MQASLQKRVRERAGNRCEYCRIRQSDDPFFRLQIDHIIAEQHDGLTAIGRATVKVLAMNEAESVKLRESVITERGTWR
jgi:hypothetical protein